MSSTASSSSATLPEPVVGQTVSDATFSAATRAAARDGGTARVHMTSPTLTESGVVRYTKDDVQESLDMTVHGKRVKVVYLDSVMYMEGLIVPHHGKSWIKASADGTDPFSVALRPMLLSLQQSARNPVSGLDATWKVTKVTDSHAVYQTSVSAAQLKKHLQSKGSSTANVSPDGEQMEETIDSHQRPLKKVVVAGRQATTMTYRDWGVKVHIKAPPEAKIATDPSVLNT